GSDSTGAAQSDGHANYDSSGHSHVRAVRNFGRGAPPLSACLGTSYSWPAVGAASGATSHSCGESLGGGYSGRQNPQRRSIQRHCENGNEIHRRRRRTMRNKIGWSVTLPVVCSLTLIFVTAGAQEHQGKEPERVVLPSEHTAPVARSVPQAPESLALTVGKSMLLDSALPMNRVSVGLGGFAEVTAVSPSEVLVNAKSPGETTLIIWQ